jgi:integrase
MSETPRVRFARAIDAFLDDMRVAGRITSRPSERAYTDVLRWHEQDAEVKDPRKTTREDVRRTLRRWSGNSQATRHSILAAFYRWLVQEGHRKDNPADQLPRARKRKPDPRLRQDEALALTMACETPRERRVIYLGLFAGLRSQELRGLQGRHFGEGLIWVSPDIAKGGRPRWLPVLAELAPVVEEIRANVAGVELVIPAQRRDPQRGEWYDLPDQPCSSQAVWRLVNRGREGGGRGHPAHLAPRLRRPNRASGWCPGGPKASGPRHAGDNRGVFLGADPGRASGGGDRYRAQQLSTVEGEHSTVIEIQAHSIRLHLDQHLLRLDVLPR